MQGPQRDSNYLLERGESSVDKVAATVQQALAVLLIEPRVSNSRLLFPNGWDMLTRLLPMALVLTQSPVAPSSAAAQVFQGHALPAWRGLPHRSATYFLRCACLSLSVSVVARLILVPGPVPGAATLILTFLISFSVG